MTLRASRGRSTRASIQAQLSRFATDVGELYRRQRERSEQLETALDPMRHAYRETVRSMAYVVEAKDAYTGQHLERCRIYGVTLMEALGVATDDPDAELGFLLHDVGKVGVSEAILNKPGPLSAAEWRVMRTHSTIGYQILSGIPGMEHAAEVVRCHHEMWTGGGYPAGLRHDEIPLPAQVFTVVDAYDAMTTDRPYRVSIGHERALDELVRVAGTQFDPDVVHGFVGVAETLPHVTV